MPSCWVPSRPIFTTTKWSNAEERRSIVKREHEQGASQTRLAKKLKVCTKTIQRDLEHLGLETFTTISDDDLGREIEDILLHGHDDMGYHDVEAALQSRHLRLQERRIRDHMVSTCAVAQQKPRTLY